MRLGARLARKVMNKGGLGYRGIKEGHWAGSKVRSRCLRPSFPMPHLTLFLALILSCFSVSFTTGLGSYRDMIEFRTLENTW